MFVSSNRRRIITNYETFVTIFFDDWFDIKVERFFKVTKNMLRRGGVGWGSRATTIKAKQAVFMNLFRSTTDYTGLELLGMQIFRYKCNILILVPIVYYLLYKPCDHSP